MNSFDFKIDRVEKAFRKILILTKKKILILISFECSLIKIGGVGMVRVRDYKTYN